MLTKFDFRLSNVEFTPPETKTPVKVGDLFINTEVSLEPEEFPGFITIVKDYLQSLKDMFASLHS